MASDKKADRAPAEPTAEEISAAEQQRVVDALEAGEEAARQHALQEGDDQ